MGGCYWATSDGRELGVCLVSIGRRLMEYKRYENARCFVGLVERMRCFVKGIVG